jgi:hypothetical protein
LAYREAGFRSQCLHEAEFVHTILQGMSVEST